MNLLIKVAHVNLLLELLHLHSFTSHLKKRSYAVRSIMGNRLKLYNSSRLKPLTM